jgi:hypothetical protein
VAAFVVFCCHIFLFRLLKHYSTYGNKWADISRAMANGRTGQQCLIRWKNQLTPGINRNFWSDEEDRALQVLKKMADLGQKLRLD